MNEIDTERLALAEELVALIKAGAQHVSALHESEAARVDDGRMTFCPGCRCIVVSKRLAQLEAFKDDTTPQRDLGNKSRRDVVLAELIEKREREAPAEVRDLRG